MSDQSAILIFVSLFVGMVVIILATCCCCCCLYRPREASPPLTTTQSYGKFSRLIQCWWLIRILSPLYFHFHQLCWAQITVPIDSLSWMHTRVRFYPRPWLLQILLLRQFFSVNKMKIRCSTLLGTCRNESLKMRHFKKFIKLTNRHYT